MSMSEFNFTMVNALSPNAWCAVLWDCLDTFLDEAPDLYVELHNVLFEEIGHDGCARIYRMDDFSDLFLDMSPLDTVDSVADGFDARHDYFCMDQMTGLYESANAPEDLDVVHRNTAKDIRAMLRKLAISAPISPKYYDLLRAVMAKTNAWRYMAKVVLELLSTGETDGHFSNLGPISRAELFDKHYTNKMALWCDEFGTPDADENDNN